jgi:hypothetical protein
MCEKIVLVIVIFMTIFMITSYEMGVICGENHHKK